MTRWTILSPLTGTISVNNALVRFEVRRRRWLFPPLVRNKTPDPVRRNRFEVALWVFNLYLPVFILRGTANSSQQFTLLAAQQRIIPEFSKFREMKDYLLMTANGLRFARKRRFLRFFPVRPLSSFPVWRGQAPCSWCGLPYWAPVQWSKRQPILLRSPSDLPMRSRGR